MKTVELLNSGSEGVFIADPVEINECFTHSPIFLDVLREPFESPQGLPLTCSNNYKYNFGCQNMSDSSEVGSMTLEDGFSEAIESKNDEDIQTSCHSLLARKSVTIAHSQGIDFSEPRRALYIPSTMDCGAWDETSDHRLDHLNETNRSLAFHPVFSQNFAYGIQEGHPFFEVPQMGCTNPLRDLRTSGINTPEQQTDISEPKSEWWRILLMSDCYCSYFGCCFNGSEEEALP